MIDGESKNTQGNDKEEIISIVNSFSAEKAFNDKIRNIRQDSKYIENLFKYANVGTGNLGKINQIAGLWSHLQTVREGEAAKVPIDMVCTGVKSALFLKYPLQWLAIEASSRAIIASYPAIEKTVVAPNEAYIAERKKVEDTISNALRPDQQVYLDTPLSEEMADAIGTFKAMYALAKLWQNPGRVIYDNLAPAQVKALSQGIVKASNAIGDSLVLHDYDREKMLQVLNDDDIDPDFPLKHSDARIWLYPFGEPLLKYVSVSEGEVTAEVGESSASQETQHDKSNFSHTAVSMQSDNMPTSKWGKTNFYAKAVPQGIQIGLAKTHIDFGPINIGMNIDKNAIGFFVNLFKQVIGNRKTEKVNFEVCGEKYTYEIEKQAGFGLGAVRLILLHQDGTRKTRDFKVRWRLGELCLAPDNLNRSKNKSLIESKLNEALSEDLGDRIPKKIDQFNTKFNALLSAHQYDQAKTLCDDFFVRYASVGQIKNQENSFQLHIAKNKVQYDAARFFGDASDLVDKGELSAAIEKFKAAQKLLPNDPDIMIDLADAYVKNQEFELGIIQAKNAVALNPEYSNTLEAFTTQFKQYLVSDAKVAIQHLEAIKNFYENSTDVTESETWMRVLNSIYMLSSNFDASEKLLQHWIEKNPNHKATDTFRLALAKIQCLNDHPDGAKKTFSDLKSNADEENAALLLQAAENRINSQEEVDNTVLKKPSKSADDFSSDPKLLKLKASAGNLQMDQNAATKKTDNNGLDDAIDSVKAFMRSKKMSSNIKLDKAAAMFKGETAADSDSLENCLRNRRIRSVKKKIDDTVSKAQALLISDGAMSASIASPQTSAEQEKILHQKPQNWNQDQVTAFKLQTDFYQNSEDMIKFESYLKTLIKQDAETETIEHAFLKVPVDKIIESGNFEKFYALFYSCFEDQIFSKSFVDNQFEQLRTTIGDKIQTIEVSQIIERNNAIDSVNSVLRTLLQYDLNSKFTLEDVRQYAEKIKSFPDVEGDDIQKILELCHSKEKGTYQSSMEIAEIKQFLLNEWRSQLSEECYLFLDSFLEIQSRYAEFYTLENDDAPIRGTLLPGMGMLIRNIFQWYYSVHDHLTPEEKLHHLDMQFWADLGALGLNVAGSAEFFFSDFPGLLKIVGIPFDPSRAPTAGTGMLFLLHHLARSALSDAQIHQQRHLHQTGQFDESQLRNLQAAVSKAVLNNGLLYTQIKARSVMRVLQFATRLAIKNTPALAKYVGSFAARMAESATKKLVERGVLSPSRVSAMRATMSKVPGKAAVCAGRAMQAINVATAAIAVYDIYQYLSLNHGEAKWNNIYLKIQDAQQHELDALKYDEAGHDDEAADSRAKAFEIYKTLQQPIGENFYTLSNSEQLHAVSLWAKLLVDNKLHPDNASQQFAELMTLLKEETIFNRERSTMNRWGILNSPHSIYHDNDTNSARRFFQLAGEIYRHMPCDQTEICADLKSDFDRETAQLALNSEESAERENVVDAMNYHMIRGHVADFQEEHCGLEYDCVLAARHADRRILNNPFYNQKEFKKLPELMKVLIDAKYGRFHWSENLAYDDHLGFFLGRQCYNIVDYLQGGDAGLKDKYKHLESIDPKIAASFAVRERLFHLLFTDTFFRLTGYLLPKFFKLAKTPDWMRIPEKVEKLLSIFREFSIRFISELLSQAGAGANAPRLGWAHSRKDASFICRIMMPLIAMVEPHIESGRSKMMLAYTNLFFSMVSMACFSADQIFYSDTLPSEIPISIFLSVIFSAFLFISQCLGILMNYHKIQKGMISPYLVAVLMFFSEMNKSFQRLNLASSTYFFFCMHPSIDATLNVYEITRKYALMILYPTQLMPIIKDISLKDVLANFESSEENTLLFAKMLGYTMVTLYLGYVFHWVMSTVNSAKSMKRPLNKRSLDKGKTDVSSSIAAYFNEKFTHPSDQPPLPDENISAANNYEDVLKNISLWSQAKTDGGISFQDLQLATRMH